MELYINNEDGEYKIEAIQNIAIYTKESESSHLSKLFIWYFRKNIQKRKIPGSLNCQFNTLKI